MDTINNMNLFGSSGDDDNDFERVTTLPISAAITKEAKETINQYLSLGLRPDELRITRDARSETETVLVSPAGLIKLCKMAPDTVMGAAVAATYMAAAGKPLTLDEELGIIASPNTGSSERGA